MLILLLNVFNPNVLISIPSNFIVPSGSISDILNKAYNIDDLPAPVLPTQPTCYPGYIKNVAPFRTKSKSDLYFILTFSNSI